MAAQNNLMSLYIVRYRGGECVPQKKIWVPYFQLYDSFNMSKLAVIEAK